MKNVRLMVVDDEENIRILLRKSSKTRAIRSSWPRTDTKR